MSMFKAVSVGLIGATAYMVVTACTTAQKNTAKTVLDTVTPLCVPATAIAGQGQEVCEVVDDLHPLIDLLLAQRKMRLARLAVDGGSGDVVTETGDAGGQ